LQCHIPDRLASLSRDGDGIRLELESGAVLEVDLVCGADGTDSRVRELAAIACRERDCGQRALTAVITHAGEHQLTAWQSFLETGPLAFLPMADDLSGHHQSAIVWSIDRDRVAEIEALDDAAFLRRLARHAPPELGEMLAAGTRVGFDLRQRLASRYVLPGLVLLGDAAHRIHPLAGQGANLGFSDVVSLRRELERALNRGLPVSSLPVLQRYQRVRRWQNDLMAHAMEAFRRGFSVRNPYGRAARNRAMYLLDQNELLKRQFRRRASGF
jgi:2-octaprenylphenol hydroxylase